MIEPPDILRIETIRLIPRAPYTVQPLDKLSIHVAGALPQQPIRASYTVSPDGTVNLGFPYGAVGVAGMTLEKAEEALRQHLRRSLREPQVSVALSHFHGTAQLRGEHLVRQDGTISLGPYGCVYVTGMTIAQAKAAIEAYLAQFFSQPQISLDVFAYNSKFYYIIIDGSGCGQQVYRLPITGNETVMDAIAHVGGLPRGASKRYIWVARPTPAHHGCVQILPVDWLGIVEGGSTETNYQLFPGDRIYVKADCFLQWETAIAKFVSPFECLCGGTLLGATSVSPCRANNGTAAAVVP
jgi:polysaccharide export outer membrane protein